MFNESRGISEAINSGERSFADFWKILSKGERFKSWLKGKSADQYLLKEYVQDISKDSWIEKVPAKTVRWSVFTVLGALTDLITVPGAGKVVGTLLSGGDTFIVDKLLKGWKPNQFINKIESDFVSRPNPLTILPRRVKDR